MDRDDEEALRRAKHLLGNPGLAMRIASFAGKPVELGLARLPARAQDVVASATRKALEAALEVAVRSLARSVSPAPRDWTHRLSVIGTGALGGFLGLATLPLELPVSTALMLRSIADHARAQGEDLGAVEARLQCLVVLALGGTSPGDDASEVGYFAVRLTFARAVAEAAEYLGAHAMGGLAADASAPALARLVARLATRFAPAVADKVAAQLAPVLGAVGGAAINTLFINHFQDMALGHFTVRRLERRYGAGEVRRAWDTLPEG